MEKRGSSSKGKTKERRSPDRQRRRGANWRPPFLIAAGFCLAAFAIPVSAGITLSSEEARRIGNKVWQNECNGSIVGLTSWNEGEDFASLGIGHFIWYPEGRPGPFEESFPELVRFISGRSVKLPQILLGDGERHCPWNSRAEFLRAQRTPKMKELRRFLADTVALQAQFLVARLQAALPKMLAEAAPSEREMVEQNFHRISSSAAGRYALVDYVNFKGEGVLHSERYKDQGWGLLQVLSEMRAAEPDAVKEFSHAASAVLRRRVANSPPERHEAKWLPGWLNRVNSYSRG